MVASRTSLCSVVRNFARLISSFAAISSSVSQNDISNRIKVYSQMKATTIKWAFLFKKPVDSCVTNQAHRSSEVRNDAVWIYMSVSLTSSRPLQTE